MRSIKELTDAHKSQVCWIVGNGPSIRLLNQHHIGQGPIIVLNYALPYVERLWLPNMLYSMQKDQWSVLPERSETPVFLHHHESAKQEFEHWPNSYEFDNEADFGIHRFTCSAPTAVMIARMMGCRAMNILCADSKVKRDLRVFAPNKDEWEADWNVAGFYLQSIVHVDMLVKEFHLEVNWQYVP